jgi:hypothetical protein
MYLRIERFEARDGVEAQLAALYRDEVLPIFGRTPGCRFAALLAPWQAREHLALTLWNADERARAYERSALHQFYLGRVGPLVAGAPESPPADNDSLETVDPTETLNAIASRLPAVGFRVDDPAPLAALAAPEPARFVRVVTVRLEPLRVERFRASFRDSIVPEVSRQPGCAGILLAERVGDPCDLRSITLWDREESAVRYELSGTSQQLTAEIAALLSPIYDWRLTPPDGLPLARRALEVTSYAVVAARAMPASASSAG